MCIRSYLDNDKDIKRVKAAIFRNPAAFQSLLETAPDAILIVDSNHDIVYVNPSAEALFGYGRDELLGQPVDVLVPENVRLAHTRFVEEYKKTPRPRSIGARDSLKARHRNGTTFPVNIMLSPLETSGEHLVLTIVQDLSQVKRAEDLLRASEMRFRALVENSYDSVALYDANGTILYQSPSVTRLLGYTPEEMVGQNLFQWLHPDESLTASQTFAGLVQKPGGRVSFEIRYRHKNGSWRWIEVAASNLLHDSSVQAVVANYRDVTERRQHLAELEAVNRISTLLRAAHTVEEILPMILEEVCSILDVGAGSIWLHDVETGHLDRLVETGWFAQIEKEPLHPHEDIAGYVFASGEPYITREFTTDSRVRESARRRIPPGWGGAGIPIRTMQDVIGVLFTSVPLPRQFTQAEIHLLTTIAEIAGNAIHRMRLHLQTEKRLERIAALHAIDKAINSSLDMRLTLNILLDQVIAQLQVDAAAVLLLNRYTFVLEFAAGRGFYTRRIERTRLRVGEGYAGRAALERTLIVINEPVLDDKDGKRSSLLADEKFQAYFAVPLVAKGHVNGILEIYSRAPGNRPPEWYDFLEALSAQAAIAIDNAAVYESSLRANLELVRAYDTTLDGWSRALDLRDRETEGHTLRVTNMTVDLARLMRVREEDLTHIRRGALLHDIGKMGIPDRILLKEGPLSEEEWQVMHKHPVYALDLLSPIEYLKTALDIPYCHHEKWDGSGYPRGLKQEQIPIAARIFAIVDVWDALNSDRPYRKAWSAKSARDYLREQSGKHFEPTVVEAFFRLMEGDYRI